MRRFDPRSFEDLIFFQNVNPMEHLFQFGLCVVEMCYLVQHRSKRSGVRCRDLSLVWFASFLAQFWVAQLKVVFYFQAQAISVA
jgi:hypothetical protein